MRPFYKKIDNNNNLSKFFTNLEKKMILWGPNMPPAQDFDFSDEWNLAQRVYKVCAKDLLAVWTLCPLSQLPWIP